MSASPLVSIALPCHNTASLLPWALASVVAQTYPNWECIVVDDGSVDRPDVVVDAFEDPRMRLIRLPHNVGRAAARQVALDAAAGEFLAKLDADDWIYPQKLARQLDIMECMPDVALVSTGIAIESEYGQLAGVRARGDGAPRPPLHGLASPPVAHAPSLIRMHIARAYGYDVRLRRSEDADYLLSLLTQHGYCVMNDVLYAYREYRSTSRSDTLDAYRARMKMLWKRRRQYPFAAPRRVAETALKWGIYQAAFATGRAGALIARQIGHAVAGRHPAFSPGSRAGRRRPRCLLSGHRRARLAACGTKALSP